MAVSRMTSPAVTVLCVAAAVAVAGCATAAPPPPAPPGPPSVSAPAPPSGPAPVASGPVDREQAGRVATARYGGRVLNVEADTARGEPTWEVEVADSRAGRIEVDVAQRTGEILEMERD